MIKAVCFDLTNTLAYFYPSREELYAQACQEFGIKVEPVALHQPLFNADTFWREENSRSPISKRSKDDRAAVYTKYATRLLRGAGLEIAPQIIPQILMKVMQTGLKLKLYDDVLPSLKLLKERNLILGLISNVDKDTFTICSELGLEHYLDFCVTSFEVGNDKPHPGIFLAALEKAQAEPQEAIHVGDQYDIDVMGARGVGMIAILLDRMDSFASISDCPRIHSLKEIVDYL